MVVEHEMKTGETVVIMHSHFIGGRRIQCHYLKVVKFNEQRAENQPLVATGTEYMLFDSEFKRNLASAEKL